MYLDHFPLLLLKTHLIYACKNGISQTIVVFITTNDIDLRLKSIKHYVSLV